MANFPALSRSPGATGFTEELSSETVQIASKASGLPVLNKIFTFDPRMFKYTLHLVSQADKESVITFYKANCDIPFDWTNTQDDNTYEVIFDHPPKCQLDKIKERWKISLTFTQYSPL